MMILEGSCDHVHEVVRHFIYQSIKVFAGTGVGVCPSPFVLHESEYAPPYSGCLDYCVDLVQLPRMVATWPRK